MRDVIKTSCKVAGRVYPMRIRAHYDERVGQLVAYLSDARAAEVEVAAQLALEGPVHREAFAFMRKALGITSEDLARLLHVHMMTISRWERGRVPVERMAFLLLGNLALEAAGRPIALRERMERFATRRPRRATRASPKKKRASKR